MPLLRYFGFAGSALVLLLFGLSWSVPQPVAEPIRSGIDRPVIRITSVEQLPERVDIDSSLPTIVPPLNVTDFAETVAGGQYCRDHWYDRREPWSKANNGKCGRSEEA